MAGITAVERVLHAVETMLALTPLPLVAGRLADDVLNWCIEGASEGRTWSDSDADAWDAVMSRVEALPADGVSPWQMPRPGSTVGLPGITEADVAWVAESASAVHDATSATAIAMAHVELERAMDALTTVPAGALLEQVGPVAQRAALTLRRDVRVATTAEGVRVARRAAAAVADVLLHAVRNAVAHAIRPASERELAGKSPTGLITVTIEASGRGVRVIVTDDGDGIPVTQLRGQMGLPDPTSDADVVRGAWSGGVSTADQVTTVAGRGAGVPAMMAAVRAMHGRLWVGTSSGRGTMVLADLPGAASAVRVWTDRDARGRGVAVALPPDARFSGEGRVVTVTANGTTYRFRGMPAAEMAAWIRAGGAAGEPAVVRLRSGREVPLVDLRSGVAGEIPDALRPYDLVVEVTSDPT